jgi:ribosomal protein S12 methylthiotransferase
MRRVRISQASDYDLVGELLDEDELEQRPRPAPSRRRVSLRVVQTDGRPMPT